MSAFYNLGPRKNSICTTKNSISTKFFTQKRTGFAVFLGY